MTSREFSEWVAFDRLEPIGSERLIYMLAVVAQTVANSQRDPKEKPSPYTVEEFLPEWYVSDEEREERLRLSLESAMPKSPRRSAPRV